jgi:ABC-type branched-subunit amino acid transport system ATPase component
VQVSETIRLKNVNKSFSGVAVARNINLKLSPGEILGLIGPNGAGKTSLFNLLTGIVPIDSGEIYFEGERIDQTSVFQRPRMGMSRTWQNIRLFPTLTVMDNLLLGAREYQGESIWRTFFKPKALKDFSEASRKKGTKLLERIGLFSDQDKKTTDFPYGQQKLIALARALMNDGGCLLLDEPMAGVEADVYDTMKTIIREEAESGKAICVIEHTISFIRDLCNIAIFMFNGEIIATGTVEELLSNKELSDIYFG